jgi:hypothetical protein
VTAREQAGHVANEWIAAWNDHDLKRIPAHCSDDFTRTSSGIATVAKKPSCAVVGKQAIGSSWQKALALVPTFRFTLSATCGGADSVAIHCESVRGPAIEVEFFNEADRVHRAAAQLA